MFTTSDRLNCFIDGAIYALLQIDTGDADEESPNWQDLIYAEQWITPAAHWERGALTPAALAQVTGECTDFFQANLRDLIRYVRRYLPAGDTAYGWHDAGTDFHLTRNHHGTGFWDRVPYHESGRSIGDRLTASSHPYGDISGLVTDDDVVEVL